VPAQEAAIVDLAGSALAGDEVQTRLSQARRPADRSTAVAEVATPAC